MKIVIMIMKVKVSARNIKPVRIVKEGGVKEKG